MSLFFAPLLLFGLQTPPPSLLVDDLRILSSDRMEGRAPATRGSARARAHIVARLKAIGIEPLYARYERPFRARHRGRPLNGINVLAQLPGTTAASDRAIVIGAHYDHVGIIGGAIHNGADDNASGVAALLAIAASLRADPPRHRVILAFWDAEEPGFYGARAFMANPPFAPERIALNINLDMISRSDRGELFAVGGVNWPRLQPVLDDVAAEAPVTLRFGHEGHLAKDEDDDWTALSDQVAFHEKGIPFVYFGVEDHPDYHQPTDTFDRIPLDFYARSVATIEAAVRALDARLDEAVPRP
ncbi:M20/M25/M40 family metallo-hydrolase [Sphingomonas sp.]